jgi:hypothetical protein
MKAASDKIAEWLVKLWIAGMIFGVLLAGSQGRSL